MRNNKIHEGRKIMGLVLAAACFFVSIERASAFEVEGAADLCKEATIRCLFDIPFSGGLGQVGFFIKLEYCLAGFEFCRKYVSLYL